MNTNEWATFWATADICIIERKVEVWGVMITSSTSTNCIVSLYDGVNSNGKLLGTFRVSGDDSEVFNFPQPFTVDHGLYIDMDANTTGVQIFYRPLSDREIK